jgi:type III secretion system low calcium response chaperone LcrH/SycD
MKSTSELSVADLPDFDINLGIGLMGRMAQGETITNVLGYTGESQQKIYAAGYSLYNQGKYADALSLLGLVLLQNHLEPRYYMAFAACLQMLKRYEDALIYYTIAAAANPADAEPVLCSAQCLMELSRFDEAADKLRSLESRMQSDAEREELRRRIDPVLEQLARRQGVTAS